MEASLLKFIIAFLPDSEGIQGLLLFLILLFSLILGALLKWNKVKDTNRTKLFIAREKEKTKRENNKRDNEIRLEAIKDTNQTNKEIAQTNQRLGLSEDRNSQSLTKVG